MTESYGIPTFNTTQLGNDERARTMHENRWQVPLTLDLNRELCFVLFLPGRIVRSREEPGLEEETFQRQLWHLPQGTFLGA